MEEKLLKIAVTMSVENILKELRKFSPEGLSMTIAIDTRTDDENTDEYAFVADVRPLSEAPFISEGYKVKWHFDPREGEGIRETIPIEGRLIEDGT